MTVDISELMRRVKEKERSRSAEVHEALAPYPKQRKPAARDLTLGKPTKEPKARCVFCGSAVAKGKTACWLHDEEPEDWTSDW